MNMVMVKIRKRLGYIVAFLLLMGVVGISVRAAEAEDVTMATLQQTTQETEIKEEPDKTAETLMRLSEGTAVIVYGESKDDWSWIEYKGVRGYVESSFLKTYGSGEIEQEFQAVEEETFRIMDEYELSRKNKRNNIIWGSVMAVIIIATFSVGIISALKRHNDEE